MQREALMKSALPKLYEKTVKKLGGDCCPVFLYV